MSKKLIFAFIQLFIFGSFIIPSEFGFPGAVMRPWEVSATVVVSTTAEVKYDFDIVLDPKRMKMRKKALGYLNPVVLTSDLFVWNDCTTGKWDVHSDGTCFNFYKKYPLLK